MCTRVEGGLRGGDVEEILAPTMIVRLRPSIWSIRGPKT